MLRADFSVKPDARSATQRLSQFWLGAPYDCFVSHKAPLKLAVNCLDSTQNLRSVMRYVTKLQ